MVSNSDDSAYWSIVGASISNEAVLVAGFVALGGVTTLVRGAAVLLDYTPGGPDTNPGLIDNGEISFTINWVPGNATDDLLVEAQAAGGARGVEVVIPSGSATSETFTFDAIDKGYEKNIPIDDRMTATASPRVTGAVTQAATA